MVGKRRPAFRRRPWRPQLDIRPRGRARPHRGAAGLHRRYALRQRRTRGSTRTSSAARCATLCSAARRANLDLVVEGDHARRSLEALGGEAVVHDRFETATVDGPGDGSIDLARARAESYPLPGRAARGAARGARRRPRPPRLHGQRDRGGGRRARRADRSARRRRRPRAPGVLRVLHDALLRATTRPGPCARPATRRGSASSPSRRTLELLRAADLATVSATASPPSSRGSPAEDRPPSGASSCSRAGAWSRSSPGRPALDRRGGPAWFRVEPWAGVADRSAIVIAATVARPPSRRPERWPPSRPGRRRHAVAAARGRSGVELVLARVLGARVARRPTSSAWRDVRLEITGEDLLAAGRRRRARRSAAALRRRCGRSSTASVRGRDEELRVALEAARGPETLI